MLKNPEFNKPFTLQTNASDKGMGAVLSQLSEQGCERPIAYFSQKLLPREEKYLTAEKKCLAIQLAVQAFDPYLMGHRFTIETNHRSLEWLNNLKDSNPRLTRWSLFLQSYFFKSSIILEATMEMQTDSPAYF